MVIVGLLSVGVALALDKYAERQALKRNQRSEGSSGQSGDSDYETGVVLNSDSDREKQELAAFNDLQNYANFQSDLSTRVLDDISREQSYLNRETLKWSMDGHTPEDSMRNLERFDFCTLSRPITVHQQQNSFGNYFWSRDYDPILEQCGLSQQTFLEFVDSFNQYLKLSPDLDVVNIAILPSRFGDEKASNYFNTVISEAVQVLKAVQMRGHNDSAMEHLNAAFLTPHGLLALVVSSQPSNPSQIISVPSQKSRPATSSQNSPSWKSPNKRTRGFPPSSTLQAETHRRSSVGSGHAPSLQDPHHNSFTSLISTVMKHREHSTRRRRARRRPFSRGLADSISHSYHNGETRTTETPVDEDIEITGEDSRQVKPGALYLIITNDPRIYEVPSKDNNVGMGNGKANESLWLGAIDPHLLDQQQRKELENVYERDEVTKAENEAPPAYSQNVENGYTLPETDWR